MSHPPSRLVPILAALALAVAACQTPEEKHAEHMRRGHAYIEAGQVPEAIIEFRSAAELLPNDGDTHFALALAYRDAGNPRDAFWELQETLRLDPENLEAKILYSRTLSLTSGKEALEEALATADEVLAKTPDAAEALLARGRALQGLARYEEARAVFARVAELQPRTAEPLLRLANVHRLEGNAEEAERIYEQAAKVEPSFGSFVNLAVFLAGLGQRDAEAEAAFRRAVDLAGDEWRVRARGVFSGFLLSRGKVREAEQVLRVGLQEAGGAQPELVYTLAKLYEHVGQSEKAEAVLREAAEAAPDDVGPLLTLSAFRRSHGDHEGAMAAVERALGLDPADPVVRLRKAYLLAEAGVRDQDAALLADGRRILEEVIESGASNVDDALVVKGRLELAEGDSEDAVFTLRRAIDLGADTWRGHYLLGAALFAQRDLPGARVALGRALGLAPQQLEVQSLLARVHSGLGEHDRAVELAKPALARTPGDLRLRMALAQSLVELGELSAAAEQIAAAPAEQQGARVQFAAARIHELRGDLEAARAGYEAADAAEPHEPGVLAALLALATRRDRVDEVAPRIEAALAARPDDARIVRLAGRVALRRDDVAGAREHFERAIELDPNDVQSYTDLSVALARAGDPSGVLPAYERALESNPENGRLHLLVGMLHESAGRTAEAMQRYESAVTHAPQLALAKNNLAYLLAETGGDLERALELAREAKERRPNDPSVSDTLGWVLYKKQLPSAAIGYLREAERGASPGDPVLGVIRQHLAHAYEENGEPERAVQVLERALREAGGDAEPPWAQEARAMLERLRGA